MVWRNYRLRMLVIGALTVALGGCADWPVRWNKQPAARPAVAPAVSAVPPPQPAPALYIPAPPQSATAESAANQTAQAPAPPAPVQDPQSYSDSKTMALPPLIPVKATVVKSTPVTGEDQPESKLRALHRLAAQKVAEPDMANYIMRLRRREVVQGRRKPEEIILVKFRTEPFSVYLKWLGNEAKDREVLYVKGRHDGLLHTKVAAGDIPFMPAGKRFSLPPDGILARSNSRHPITHAGLGHLVEQFGQIVATAERHDARFGAVKYLGVLNRPEFDAPVEGVMQLLLPGNDTLLPGGGRRLWYFDSKSHLPVLVIAHDERQQEVEYYCHDRFFIPGGLTDDDFNPDKLWGKQTP